MERAFSRLSGTVSSDVDLTVPTRENHGTAVWSSGLVETLNLVRDPNGVERATIRTVSEVPVPVCWG